VFKIIQSPIVIAADNTRKIILINYFVSCKLNKNVDVVIIKMTSLRETKQSFTLFVILILHSSVQAADFIENCIFAK